MGRVALMFSATLSCSRLLLAVSNINSHVTVSRASAAILDVSPTALLSLVEVLHFPLLSRHSVSADTAFVSPALCCSRRPETASTGLSTCSLAKLLCAGFADNPATGFKSVAEEAPAGKGKAGTATIAARGCFCFCRAAVELSFALFYTVSVIACTFSRVFALECSAVLL